MSKRKREIELIRDVVGTFIEEAGADALVLIYSTVKRNRTQTYLIPYGNAHTCSALIDYAYENYQPENEEAEETETDD